MNDEEMENENKDASPRNIQREISLEADDSKRQSDFETIKNSIVSEVLAAFNGAPATTAISQLGRKRPRPNSHDVGNDCLYMHQQDYSPWGATPEDDPGNLPGSPSFRSSRKGKPDNFPDLFPHSVENPTIETIECADNPLHVVKYLLHHVDEEHSLEEQLGVR